MGRYRDGRILHPCQNYLQIEMYMRYYPRQLKQTERLKVRPADKGRRHYWGYEKADYGLYSTEDQKYISRAHSHLRDHQPERSQSYDITKADYSAERRMSTARDCTNTKYEQTSRKTLEIVNPIDIHLPAIGKKSTETQTDLQPNPETVRLNYPSPDKPQDNQQLPPRAPLTNTRHKRVYTQILQARNYNPMTPCNNMLSPTFVCSIKNPLPTYIIEPHVYKPRTYLRSHTQY